MNLFLVGHKPALPGLQPFADALQRHTDSLVTVQPLEGLRVGSGFVLADGRRVLEALLTHAPLHEAGLAPRTLVLNANRWEIDELLEEHELAGGVDKRSLFAWRQQKPGSRGAFWLHGRRSVARAMPVPARVSGLHQTARYCALGGELYVGLPDLIVRYLRVLDGTLTR